MKMEPALSAAPVERLVIRLVVARDALKAAKAARRQLAERLGRCDGYNHESGPCFRNPDSEQCDICNEKKPVFEAYQKAATEAGVALRMLVNAGRRLGG